MQTDVNGAPRTDFGPYLQQLPINNFTNGANLAGDNSQDWECDETTGLICAVVPAAVIAEFNMSPNNVVAQ